MAVLAPEEYTHILIQSEHLFSSPKQPQCPIYFISDPT